VRAVDAVLATSGAAFIHCAFATPLGHGAAAVLVRRGEATLADVERKMRAVRPRIRAQRAPDPRARRVRETRSRPAPQPSPE